MTPYQWVEIGAVIAFVAGVVRGVVYVMDRIEAISRRVNAESLAGLREAIAESATDLRQGMDGIQKEVAFLRSDFHNLTLKADQHDRDITTLTSRMAAIADFCRYTHQMTREEGV